MGLGGRAVCRTREAVSGTRGRPRARSEVPYRCVPDSKAAAVTGPSSAGLPVNCEKRGPSARVPAYAARAPSTTPASSPRAAAGGRPPF